MRDDWPDEEIHLFGPGVDSGTFDYFTEAIVGESGASRGDYTSSEDDNVLVQGVTADRQALGFFGFAYYEENRDRLKVVGVADEGTDTFITPSPASVGDGTYKPLSRPLFIYSPARRSRYASRGEGRRILSRPCTATSTGGRLHSVTGCWLRGGHGSVSSAHHRIGRLESTLREPPRGAAFPTHTLVPKS